MLEGCLLGILFYIMGLALVLFIYPFFSPLMKRHFIIILLCWVGHYLGCLIYSFMTSDSMFFFENSSPFFEGFGTAFVKLMTWYVSQYLTNHSFLATLYFFSAFAFIGSVLWYLLFLQLAGYLKINCNQYIFPAVVIMCWPSFLFFTSGIGKDSLCYFLLPVIFISGNRFFMNKSVMLCH